MNPNFARRRYIVDWKLQGPICLHGLLYGGFVLLAILVGIFLPLVWDLGSATQAAGFEERSIVMLYMHERLWWLIFGCGVIVAISAIKLSHRIAGPLVRYKRNLRLVAEGKLPPPLRTRPNDYLQEEVACLNLAVEGVQTRIAAIRRAQGALAAEAQALAARTPQSAPAFASLLAASRDLEQAVGAFVVHETGDERKRVEPVAAAVAIAGGGNLTP